MFDEVVHQSYVFLAFQSFFLLDIPIASLPFCIQSIGFYSFKKAPSVSKFPKILIELYTLYRLYIAYRLILFGITKQRS